MSSAIVRLLLRWLGWEWVVLVVQRGNVGTLKLPGDLPVSARLNTDDTVSVTIGHRNDGDALLVELRSLMT